MKRKKMKTIALIAHDHKKADIVNWALKNKETLSKYELCGTGTTAKLVSEATDLKVKRYLSGPLGGDQQIGAKIAEGKVDLVVFFWDPLESQPHDPDVKALLRISVVYDIPIATNRATADYVIRSTLLND
ncbi:MAG: methylglyoxal synthase [Clostridia bacterium]|nr:methylglyoxal synthase [Clostridia bacterium]